MQPAVPPSLPRCCCFLPSSHCHLHRVAKETPMPRCSLLKSPPYSHCALLWLWLLPPWPQQASACADCSSCFLAATKSENGKPLPAGSPFVSWSNSKSPWILKINKWIKSPRIHLSPPNSHQTWWELTPSSASIILRDSSFLCNCTTHLLL